MYNYRSTGYVATLKQIEWKKILEIIDFHRLFGPENQLLGSHPEN